MEDTKAPEVQLITCKVCGEPKNRIRAGKFGKKGGRTPRWVGVSGSMWNGLVCPECHIKQVAVRQYIKRVIKDGE